VFPRGNRQQDIFLDDDDRRLYLSLLEGVVERCGWQLLAYALMTNHSHVVVRTPKPNLGAGLSALHSRYALAFNRRHGLKSHLLHRPSQSKPARDEATVRYWAIYLALNPVRAGMVDAPEAYRWSSYAAALGLEPAPAWLDVGALIALFGSRERLAGLVEAVRAIGPAGFDPITADRMDAQRPRGSS
jgi:REP element-mobilizing transposase RayT